MIEYTGWTIDYIKGLSQGQIKSLYKGISELVDIREKKQKPKSKFDSNKPVDESSDGAKQFLFTLMNASGVKMSEKAKGKLKEMLLKGKNK